MYQESDYRSEIGIYYLFPIITQPLYCRGKENV